MIQVFILWAIAVALGYGSLYAPYPYSAPLVGAALAVAIICGQAMQ